MVKVDVDTSYARSLNSKHQNYGEFICIFNRDDALLYSGKPDIFSTANTLSTKTSVDSSDDTSFLLTLNDTDYLGVLCTSIPYGLK